MPGRKKTPVTNLFEEVESDAKLSKVKCIFCAKEISKNGTRMRQHIEKCKDCGDEIKMKYSISQLHDEADEPLKDVTDTPKIKIKKIEVSTASCNSSIRKSGRKKTPVTHLFEEIKREGKKSKVKCIFCATELGKNGTRMCQHIARCKECGDDIKLKYLNPQQHEEALQDVADTPQEYMNNGVTSCASPFELSSRPPSKPKNYSPQQPPFSSKKKINPYMDKMSPTQTDQVQMEMARAIYASGCPLNMLGNKHWKRVFCTLRPSFKLPIRDVICSSLLEKVYEETTALAREVVASALSVALIFDGWSNIRNDGIINVVVTVPKPLYWRSVATGAEGHAGEYMAATMKEVVLEVGGMRVLAICTDHALNMSEAWDSLKADFPHMQMYGCLAHTLHLLLTDISTIQSAHAMQQDCIAVVKAVKTSQKLTALLRQHQQLQPQQSLKLPVQTRLGSIIHCMDSLHQNKEALQALATNEEAKLFLDIPIHNLLLSQVFWCKLEGFLTLLRPVADAIAAVEGDQKNLSLVMKVFADLHSSFKGSASSNPLLKSEEEIFKNIIQMRKLFHTKPIHLAADLLDPRYRGCHITGEEAVDAMEVISELADALPDIDESRVLGEIADYRSGSKLFSKPYVWKAAAQISSTSWWNGICSSTELSKVASRVLDLPPTSAAVERSFSRHSFIHSKQQNRLPTDRAAKLVYMAHNINVMDEQEMECQRRALKPPAAGDSVETAAAAQVDYDSVYDDISDNSMKWTSL